MILNSEFACKGDYTGIMTFLNVFQSNIFIQQPIIVILLHIYAKLKFLIK